MFSAALADSDTALPRTSMRSPAMRTTCTACVTALLPSSVARTAWLVERWMSFKMVDTSPVAWRDCSARARISCATMANPLPSSPARAASMEALSANRFDCSASSLTLVMMRPTAWACSASRKMRSAMELTWFCTASMEPTASFTAERPWAETCRLSRARSATWLADLAA